MVVPPLALLSKVSFAIQIMSTKFAVLGLNLIGTHAVREGTKILLDDITVVVGAPCSGFRMLIALVAFTVFFVYMKVGPLWGRLSLVGFVVPLSLFANSVRVLLIALVAQYYGEDAMHKFHDWSGWIVLALTFVLLIQIAKVVKCRDFKSMPA
jgi:exosortase